MQAGLDEIRRIIREEEPERPSTRLSTLTAADLTEVAEQRHAEPAKLSSLIRGDLDWIVMKALEKDRARRYETANGLAADIQRHLNCQPVVARPPSRLYEFQKTVRRHKVGFAAAAAVIMTLVVGVVVSTAEAIRATRAERGQRSLREAAQEAQATEAKLRLEAQRNEGRAETEAARSAQVAQFMKDMLKGVGPAVAQGRDTKLLHEILDNTAERVGKDLTNQPSVEAELRTTIGEAYYAIGAHDKAKTMLRQAVELRKQVRGSGQTGLAISMKDLAMVLWREGQFVEAETLARDALAIERAALGGQHLAVADSLRILGTILNSKHDLAGAEDMLRQALDIRRKLLGEEHLDVAEALGDLAAVLQRQGKLVEAETMIREALTTNKKLLGSEHPSLAGTLNGLGNVLRQEGKLPEAESVLRDALKMRRKLLGQGHPDLVQSLNNLGKVLEAEGKLDDAEALYQEVLTICRTLPGADRTDAGASAASLAAIARRQRRLQKAEDLSREGLAMAKKFTGNESRAVDHSLVQLADILHDEGKLVEAESMAREELAVERALSGPAAANVGKSLHRLADILYDQGKWADAEARCREAVALFKQSAQDNPTRSDSAIDLGHTQWRLADVLTKTGRRDQAEGILREAIKVFEKAARGFPAQPYLRQEEGYSTWMLATMLEDAGRLDAAEAEYREAIALHETGAADFPNWYEGVFRERLGTVKVRLVELVRWRGILREAKSMYREAAEHGGAPELNEYAWFLASCRDANVRDGTNAVAFAEKAVAATIRKNANYLDTLSAAYAETGQFAKAISIEQEAISVSQSEKEKRDLTAQLLPYENNSPRRDQPDLAALTAQLTKALLEENKFTQAESMARECLTIREKELPDDWRTFNTRSMLGGALLGQKKYAEAEPLLLSGYEGMKQREDKIPQEGKPRLRETLERLVQLHEATDRPDQAAKWKRKLELFSGEEAERKVAAKP
jgi:tetratricopeptide (TPR) repeat protein